MRRIAGVPLVYVNRSVMIMEPMSEVAVEVREGSERGKLRSGLMKKEVNKGALGKRKRDDDSDQDREDSETNGEDRPELRDSSLDKRRKKKGPKGANPLSVRKPKQRNTPGNTTQNTEEESPINQGSSEKRRRKRKSSKKSDE